MNPRLPDFVCREHSAYFHQPPAWMAYAPGRVEILGNHTDYNNGLAIAAAIDTGICAAVSQETSPYLVLRALDLQETVVISLPLTGPSQLTNAKTPLPGWAKYAAGAAYELTKEKKSQGLALSLSGNIPIGAGLSSSAALTVASALALSALLNIQKSLLELAELCQRAENNFAGTNCGLLDQLASLYGKANELVMPDFQTLEISRLPFPDNCALNLADTGVSHTLADSAYNERRRQCAAAARFFETKLNRQIKTLRDVTFKEYQAFAAHLDPLLALRAKHVFEENQRVSKAATALISGQARELGKLMSASHLSSKINYENSGPELDFLAELAESLPGVLGARLSGGGFGGSVIILSEPGTSKNLDNKLKTAFAKQFKTNCTVRPILPSEGARLL